MIQGERKNKRTEGNESGENTGSGRQEDETGPETKGVRFQSGGMSGGGVLTDGSQRKSTVLSLAVTLDAISHGRWSEWKCGGRERMMHHKEPLEHDHGKDPFLGNFSGHLHTSLIDFLSFSHNSFVKFLLPQSVSI